MNDEQALQQELDSVYIRPTDAELLKESVEKKLLLAETNPGLEVPFDPDEAEFAGYFEETALSAEDALEAAMLGAMPNP